MPTNTSEFEPGHDDETVDEPFDGRESQPVSQGSSDDPRTLDALDPLRDAELLVNEGSGHEARPGEEATPAINEEVLETEPADEGGQRFDTE